MVIWVVHLTTATTVVFSMYLLATFICYCYAEFFQYCLSAFTMTPSDVDKQHTLVVYIHVNKLGMPLYTLATVDRHSGGQPVVQALLYREDQAHIVTFLQLVQKLPEHRHWYKIIWVFGIRHRCTDGWRSTTRYVTSGADTVRTSMPIRPYSMPTSTPVPEKTVPMERLDVGMLYGRIGILVADSWWLKQIVVDKAAAAAVRAGRKCTVADIRACVPLNRGTL